MLWKTRKLKFLNIPLYLDEGGGVVEESGDDVYELQEFILMEQVNRRYIVVVLIARHFCLNRLS